MSNDPGDPHLRRIAVDPDAFEAFYREHLDAIHRFVARRVADPHHASTWSPTSSSPPSTAR